VVVAQDAHDATRAVALNEARAERAREVREQRRVVHGCGGAVRVKGAQIEREEGDGGVGREAVRVAHGADGAQQRAPQRSQP
jgi:hypothetical protein